MDRQTFGAALAQARDLYVHGDLRSALVILERLSEQFPAEPSIQGPLKTVRNALRPGGTVSPRAAGLAPRLRVGTVLAGVFSLTVLPAAVYAGKTHPELDFLAPLAHLFVAAALAYPVALAFATARNGFSLPAAYLLAFLALLVTDVAYSAAGEAALGPDGALGKFCWSTEEEAEKAYQQGLAYYQPTAGVPDYEAAVECFLHAATEGHSGAQFYLGCCLSNGRGVPKDPELAFLSWLISAESGFIEAQVQVGRCYLLGEVVPADATRAIHWFTESAKAGDINCQVWLGDTYNEGQIVMRDTVQAAEWYERAARRGHVDAQKCLGLLYGDETGEVVDLTLAAYWFRKAAEAGNLEAQACIADCYMSGKGIVRNRQQAAEWYTKAASRRHTGAERSLGLCYELGEGVELDYAQAAYWYGRAAWKGDSRAQFYLGRLHEQGRGVERSNILAYTWYGVASSDLEEAAVARASIANHMSHTDLQSAQERISAFAPVVNPQSDAYIYRTPGG